MWVMRRIGILACCGLAAVAFAQPPDLVKRIAARETENEAARAQFMYRQKVTIEELDKRGAKAGEYREVRDIIFSPEQERLEEEVGKPYLGLRRLKLTDDDFRDLREVQPVLLTSEKLRWYDTRFRGDERVDGLDCWVLQIRPKQILDGQRLFDGMLWVDKRDYSIVRTAGRAVPQHLGTTSENLFPAFTTIRQKVADGLWLPVYTLADDTLPFHNGPLRMRMKIEYSNYKKFGSDSTIQFITEPSSK